MLRACERFLRNTMRALLGPRHTWDLSAEAKRLYSDLPARLQDALARAPGAGNSSDEQPVFLFSAGWRSGSTLLQRMLMEHNEGILMWGEPFAHANIHDNLLNHFRCFTPEWPPDSFFLSKRSTNNISDTWAANLYPDVECLFDAHRSFYRSLFAEPAARAGWRNWGFKAVRLTIEHAAYFRALFPKCKIVLLYRHPHDAYLSYRDVGLTWALIWPRFITTPYEFGHHWARMTRGFLEGYQHVGAYLIRYEDLDDPAAIEGLQTYLGWPVPRSSQMRRIRTSGQMSADSQSAENVQLEPLPAAERIMLHLATREVLGKAGYVRDGAR